MDEQLSLTDKGETKGDKEGQRETGRAHRDKHTGSGRRKACVSVVGPVIKWASQFIVSI